ncbi:LacI family DNA-binding transcriptional regulator [Clostridium oryzae]|uniref:HTH-type transcriptional repressor CytR n=1 Tax=Clostridium oryzae TaxID=1450648 RepID=A0A1V4IQE3_9CLOT|nr:LacI family DNA-binding transcriptional regulator [Clostridium oryzae]OPJ62123.1 HTH-type transcriptional repressor CytR [Clostridium oryzae]
MAVTIKDIAKIAGVNHSTVSRSLNDSPLVAKETKKRILKIAKDMGFEFNANARGLKSSKTKTIALIHISGFTGFDVNMFFMNIQNNVCSIFESKGYDVISTTAKNQFNGESNIKKLISSNKVDGFIVCDDLIQQDDMKLLENCNLPFLFLHQRPKEKTSIKFEYFGTDHFKGGYIATKHLIEQQRKNIICISFNSGEFDQRTDGMKQAMKDNGIEPHNAKVFIGDLSFSAGERIIIENRNLLSSIDAIFAQSDLMALGAVSQLLKYKIKVPEDIAVIGYDDIELSHILTPKLSTIHQPIQELSSFACERLLMQLQNGKNNDSAEKILEPSLVIRETTNL